MWLHFSFLSVSQCSPILFSQDEAFCSRISEMSFFRKHDFSVSGSLEIPPITGFLLSPPFSQPGRTEIEFPWSLLFTPNLVYHASSFLLTTLGSHHQSHYPSLSLSAGHWDHSLHDFVVHSSLPIYPSPFPALSSASIGCATLVPTFPPFHLGT